MPTHYEVLRVDYSATPEQIRAAYTTLVSEAGPQGSAPDPKRFQAVEKAYQTLIDPFLRTDYNRGQLIDDLIPPVVYEHAVALQEKFGHYGEAFGHFDRLIKKGYAPAALAIKNLANAVIQASSSPSPKTFYMSFEDYLEMAKAFADPSKPYYDEVIASSLYRQLYQLAQASAENAWWLQVKPFVYYILGRRLALGVGLEKDEKAAYSLWSGLDTEQRGLLIGHCAEDIHERRKRAILPQGKPFTAEDDIRSEPLVQFLQDKIVCCSLSSEKAKYHLELAGLFRRLGAGNEVRHH